MKIATEEKTKSLVSFHKDYAYVDLSDFSKEHDYIKSNVICTLLDRLDGKKQATSQSVWDILEMIEKGSGRIDFSKNLFVSLIYNKLFFVTKNEDKPFSYCADNLTATYLKECDKTVSFKITDKKIKTKNCIFLDFEKTDGRKITVRSRNDGDTFSPSGLNGKKKLKDYFIDEKIPVFLRNSVPLIVIDDEIACVGTMRVCEKFKPNSNTNKFLRIEISDGGNTDDTKEC